MSEAKKHKYCEYHGTDLSVCGLCCRWLWQHEIAPAPEPPRSEPPQYALLHTPIVRLLEMRDALIRDDVAVE